VGIFGIISTVLEILLQYLKLKVAESQISLQKVAYDIDQTILAKGAALQAKVDSARNAGDLVVVEQLRTDYDAFALYGSGVKLLIPDYAGRDNVGVSPKVSGVGEPEHPASNGPQPTEGAKPSGTA